MNTIDLSFYLDPPELTVSGTLHVTPLAPLSMVTSQPGTYFRSELTPPEHMLHGAIENALGWHFHDSNNEGPSRKDLLKQLAKLAKKRHRKNPDYGKDHPWLSEKPEYTARSKYFSLLQYHLRIEPAAVPDDLMSYDDLWSMHLRDRGMNFVGGSRAYDYRLEHLITRLRTPDGGVEVGDRKEFERIDLEDLATTEAPKINAGSLGERFPMYYVSPKKRAFVTTRSGYVHRVRTTPGVARLLTEHLSQPTAPPYLGTNEGWVSLEWTADV